MSNDTQRKNGFGGKGKEQSDSAGFPSQHCANDQKPEETKAISGPPETKAVQGDSTK